NGQSGYRRCCAPIGAVLVPDEPRERCVSWYRDVFTFGSVRRRGRHIDVRRLRGGDGTHRVRSRAQSRLLPRARSVEQRDRRDEPGGERWSVRSEGRAQRLVASTCSIALAAASTWWSDIATPHTVRPTGASPSAWHGSVAPQPSRKFTRPVLQMIRGC